jgi:hypothetical protein
MFEALPRSFALQKMVQSGARSVRHEHASHRVRPPTHLAPQTSYKMPLNNITNAHASGGPSPEKPKGRPTTSSDDYLRSGIPSDSGLADTTLIASGTTTAENGIGKPLPFEKDAERVEMRIQLATQLDQARTIVRDQAALQQQRVAQQAEIQQQKVALQQQQAALEQQQAALQQQQAEMEAANAEHDDLLARCNSLQAFSQTQALAQGHAELAQQQLWQGQAPTAAQNAALDEEADALLAEIEEVEPFGY